MQMNKKAFGYENGNKVKFQLEKWLGKIRERMKATGKNSIFKTHMIFSSYKCFQAI